MTLTAFNQELTVYGEIIGRHADRLAFTLKARSGDAFEVEADATTAYTVVSNLDGVDRDRTVAPEAVGDARPESFAFERYVSVGRKVMARGVYQQNGGASRFVARNVILMHSKPDAFVFEETHWWITQTTQIADRILDHLFDSKRSYRIDDFSKFYQTQLNIVGQVVDDTTQECAVLARLIYDLSTAYLTTGAERYFLAARAAIDYQRQAFRSISHDGRYVFWAFGRRRALRGEKGEELILASRGPYDLGAIPLYEQIYAICGLTQFYRITGDREVLADISRTLKAFRDFYHDPPAAKAKGFAGTGGYYAHLDPVTMRPDAPELGLNRSQKNWNSIGDHIPAYLVNLILALDPLPHDRQRQYLEPLLSICLTTLEEVTDLIIEKFPDSTSDYVNERFNADWTPNHNYGWQLDRAIVGHNLKIAWNLTRCAGFFEKRAAELARRGEEAEAAVASERAGRALHVARRLGERMAEVGLDKLRGGVFDCVERHPREGMPIQFAWSSTKDFWQQEQGVLAYLVLHGAFGKDSGFLDLARECAAFWNVFFLDRERQGYFFRVTENGVPVLDGEYGRKSGHAIGYHAFELAYLAQVYTRTLVDSGAGADRDFCLYFKLAPSGERTFVNVGPDFLPPGRLRVTAVRVNGRDATAECAPQAPDDFHVRLAALPEASAAEPLNLIVEYRVVQPSP